MKDKIKKFFKSMLFDKICFFIPYFAIFILVCALWVKGDFYGISTILFIMYIVDIIQFYYVYYIFLPRQKQKIEKLEK